MVKFLNLVRLNIFLFIYTNLIMFICTNNEWTWVRMYVRTNVGYSDQSLVQYIFRDPPYNDGNARFIVLSDEGRKASHNFSPEPHSSHFLARATSNPCPSIIVF